MVLSDKEDSPLVTGVRNGPPSLILKDGAF